MWPFFFSGDVVQEDWQFVTEGRVPLHKDEWLLSGPVKLQRPSNTLHGYIMLQHLLSHPLACSFAQLMHQLCFPKRQSLPKPSLFSLPNTESPDDDELRWKSFLRSGRSWLEEENKLTKNLLGAGSQYSFHGPPFSTGLCPACFEKRQDNARQFTDTTATKRKQLERNLVAWLIYRDLLA